MGMLAFGFWLLAFLEAHEFPEGGVTVRSTVDLIPYRLGRQWADSLPLRLLELPEGSPNIEFDEALQWSNESAYLCDSQKTSAAATHPRFPPTSHDRRRM